MKKSLTTVIYFLAGLVLVLIGCDSQPSTANRDIVGTTVWSQQKVETIAKEEKVIQFRRDPGTPRKKRVFI